MEELRQLIIETPHTEHAIEKAIEAYIAEHQRRYGFDYEIDARASVALDKHYEEDGTVLDDDWQTTVTVQIENNDINILFH